MQNRGLVEYHKLIVELRKFESHVCEFIGVIIAVLGTSSGFIGIWWKAFWRSIFEKKNF